VVSPDQHQPWRLLWKPPASPAYPLLEMVRVISLETAHSLNCTKNIVGVVFMDDQIQPWLQIIFGPGNGFTPTDKSLQ
jgi:hypothetical protein